MPDRMRSRPSGSGQISRKRSATATTNPRTAVERRTSPSDAAYTLGSANPPCTRRKALTVRRSVSITQYSLTPDRDFVIDAVPEHPAALVAIGGGHGFKFAPVIGEVLADIVQGMPPRFDLQPSVMYRMLQSEARRLQAANAWRN